MLSGDLALGRPARDFSLGAARGELCNPRASQSPAARGANANPASSRSRQARDIRALLAPGGTTPAAPGPGHWRIARYNNWLRWSLRVVLPARDDADAGEPDLGILSGVAVLRGKAPLCASQCRPPSYTLRARNGFRKRGVVHAIVAARGSWSGYRRGGFPRKGPATEWFPP
jgi:hypothetical protein